MKLIDYDKLRSELIDRMQIAYSIGNYDGSSALSGAIDLIEDCTVMDTVKHGKWIINTDDFTPTFRCTRCGYNKPMIAGVGANNDPGRYCQNCGAKMEGVDVQ